MYAGKETDGQIADDILMYPVRKSDCSLEGATEEISSDVKIPDTRIPSTPEKGSESCSGDISTEWNIDDQDDFLASVFCGEWETSDESVEDYEKKILTLGDVVSSFSFLKKYSQTPIDYQWFKKCFINQLTINMATDSFVKMSWNVMGSNNPKKVNTDPLASYNPQYQTASTTKSFMTNSGFLKIGNVGGSLNSIRQASDFELTINNNMEKTPALFETESIENSLGDFNVSGSMNVFNADDTAHNLYNDAVDGKDKVIQVKVSRTINGVEYSYTITLRVHLGAPQESQDGNKLKFSIPFTLNDVTDLSIIKETTLV